MNSFAESRDDVLESDSLQRKTGHMLIVSREFTRKYHDAGRALTRQLSSGCAHCRDRAPLVWCPAATSSGASACRYNHRETCDCASGSRGDMLHATLQCLFGSIYQTVLLGCYT